jgi:hypothetical protein
MAAPGLTLAEVFQTFAEPLYRKYGRPPPHLQRAVQDVIDCRTPVLGGHRFACVACGVETQRYNSCRNRHCPRCQALDKEEWVEKRKGELLPVTYFHLVFTLPDLVNRVALGNPAAIYSMLLRTAAKTLVEIAADRRHLGARIGFLAVLHTWGQRLQLHPHVHVVVPGGGIAVDEERWTSAPEKFFLPVKVLGRLFRGKFLAGLEEAAASGELRMPESLDPEDRLSGYVDWLRTLHSRDWVVYCKPPFGGSEQALGYLARYTHRAAITSSRLVRIEEDRVLFRWKDYAADGAMKTTSLHGVEFLRRFLQHVLPPRFHRIRYFGLLANCHRREQLERCRRLLGLEQVKREEREGTGEAEGWEERMLRITGLDPRICPVCKEGRLECVGRLAAQPGRGPPSGAA